MSGTGRLRLRTTKRRALTVVLFLAAVLVPMRGQPGAHDRVVGHATDVEEELLVLVRGTGICSGSPITGTNLVVTAAHCVLDKRTGEVSTRHDLRVERASKRYDIAAIIVDALYGPEVAEGRIHPEQDAAILVMTSPVPGPGVRLDERAVNAMQDEHDVVLVGYQPVGVNGSIHREDLRREPTRPVGGSPADTYVGHAAASCTNRWGSVKDRDGVYSLRCGMVPGGSGGPLVVADRDGYVLVGVLSSVNRSLTWNGVTPVAEVRRLLDNAERFSVALPGATSWAPTDRYAPR